MFSVWPAPSKPVLSCYHWVNTSPSLSTKHLSLESCWGPLCMDCPRGSCGSDGGAAEGELGAGCDSVGQPSSAASAWSGDLSSSALPWLAAHCSPAGSPRPPEGDVRVVSGENGDRNVLFLRMKWAAWTQCEGSWIKDWIDSNQKFKKRARLEHGDKEMDGRIPPHQLKKNRRTLIGM